MGTVFRIDADAQRAYQAVRYGSGIRYDKVFEPMGVYTEHVEKNEEIIPALERALKSGKTALVNVIGDKRIGHPTLGGNLLGSTKV